MNVENTKSLEMEGDGETQVRFLDVLCNRGLASLLYCTLFDI